MAAPRQERKVVTVLFADLVGFTARAEAMDPEDVVGLLEPYHARLRSELERYGGTVEKFIGDAVMAVFGAPVAHEDDPERAVRAALAIRESLRSDEPGLEFRIGVNTGEALVSLGARPEEGEAMVAGDVVNTAARLQTAAPTNGILVGQATYRATRDAIDYQEAEAVEAKGKAHPLPVWEAREARARIGVDFEQRGRAPLVGREREVDVLRHALLRVRSDSSPQLLTLVGVPGIGKSRLVWELLQLVEHDPDLIYWRQGRCLPYGEGVTYWAVGEMVKAQAGVLDTDSAEEAGPKLERAVAAAMAEEAGRVLTHLRPLVGLADEPSTGHDTRAESFAAWRRFFEGLAEQRALVLVFEDLHWADDGLLDFVDHLVDWATGVPLLVLCTARPELLERRPGWGGGKLNATTLALSPLIDADAARLVAALIGQTLLPADTQAALLARAGGNPLYAEQYARMFAERGSAEDLPLPENVHGIIAARLDALTPGQKAALQDAAVIGKVFWPGAVAAIGADGAGLEEVLHGLERKDFVRRERRSTVAGEVEFAFRHVLVRDVAYGQIPRARRAAKHHRAAEWIESLGGRTDDMAEMLAHHYSSALEFARASGADTEELEERARFALRRAGERALALSAYEPAVRFLGAALELWPAEDPDRALLQLDLARAKRFFGDADPELLAEARRALVEQGRLDLAGVAEMTHSFYWWNVGNAVEARRHLEAAVALVDGAPASEAKAFVLGSVATYLLVAGELERSIRVAEEALAVARDVGDEHWRGQALTTIGSVRFALGDVQGVDELEQALELGERIGSGENVIRACKNLGDALQRKGDLERAEALHRRGAETARRLGDRFHIRWFKAELAFEDYLAGRWQDALTAADEFLDEVETGSPHYMESICRQIRALIRLARGDPAGAAADLDRLLEYTRGVGDAQVLRPALCCAARVSATTGDARGAVELLEELEALSLGERIAMSGPTLAELVFVSELLDRTLPQLPRDQLTVTMWGRGAAAAAEGDFAGAADVCAEIGARTPEADYRLLAARRLMLEGRRAEADEQLRRALAFYRSVGATAYVRQTEALLPASA